LLGRFVFFWSFCRTSTEPPVPTHHSDMGKNSIIDQYQAAKGKHPGMMLLFRVGDFYELFYQDAEEASKLLGLTLTTRDRVHPMAGFPHHQLQPCPQKLLQAGRRLAIRDQVGASCPDGTTEPVREVRRVLSPQETVLALLRKNMA
jgi:DNA mismatch repair ATPase MutS